MKRILIIGSGGAGKSTLAKQIGHILNLNVIHLDAYYWQPGWVTTPLDIWKETLKELLAGESWVMDGNFRSTMDLRMERADTIIYLDFSPLVCTYRVIKRTLTYKGKSRPDMAEDCPERFESEFIRWVWTYRKKNRDAVKLKLEGAGKDKQICILKNKKDVKNFLENLKASTN